MNAVQFDRVSRHYGEVKAVDDISFQIPSGEFFTLLGPSGSGKTTCLRMIAGFEYPSDGEIRLFGEPCSTVPPYDRNLNTVFQDYALFPNMDVRDNIGYGLMLKGVAKAERYRKVDEMLELVRLPGVGKRRPSQLSGGQRQRIAIARALINQPRILLLDEPLGALDLKLREQMQLELKALQRQLGITFIFVTHDQQEALSMSDRICIFSQGKIEQIAAPDTIYDAPATPFVARFVGTVNLFEGEQARRLCGDGSQMMVRPERIRLNEAGTPGWSGEIREVEYLGPFVRYRVSLGEQIEIIVNHPNEGQARLSRGTQVSLSWPEQAIHRLSATHQGAQP
ncbi:polyamine ABC transporter ATP-binding protein [Aeromonas allosaccharophila]|uniref:ABC transporter ATP-binding protein n=1 Tax=Aeromonas allosaccharophila TaxID=656 RepID=UPI0005B1E365|nr:ABC transporter ATP-binding protein [Aeromonas allosaccharophila]OKP45048.1 polyamine ABC transporter ATP-binding protein [Aeromonas allosaccharophila]